MPSQPPEPDADADPGDDLETRLRMADDWAQIARPRVEADVQLDRDRAELFQLYLQLDLDGGDFGVRPPPPRRRCG